jgi:hypothetical protein
VREARIEHVLGAMDVRAQAGERLVDDEPHSHGGGEVEHPVGAAHRLVDCLAVEHGSVDDGEAGLLLGVLKVVGAARRHVVEHDYLVACSEQVLNEVTADEPGSAGDCALHLGRPYRRIR